ncbi:two-component sensor histidine kinase [Marivita lacus]|uniref:histidine kinase n=1 Tax=Marivita lacus TaxID=1323742 RepID=A0ABQ1KE75_9RHOB|nr:ATP-binding protein [Marivita lacus]GGB93920.1 two-component sensor histidine kinase [Marivita lacus]
MTDTLTKPSPHTGDPSSRRGLFLLAAVLGLCVIAIGSYLVLASYFLRTEAAQTPERAQFFASSIDDALTRLEHLPYVLSIDESTVNALVTGETAELNPILADIASRAGAEFVFVLDLNGKTVASSNYRDTDSLVGKYYTFRPYFRDAVVGGAGRFYAVGVTTGRPGYFIAEPVRDETGTIQGVVTVKIGFNDLNRALSGNGELVLVADEQGVVLASSDPDLIYGYMAPLSDGDRRTLAEQQQFGGETLFPLDWTPESDRRARLDGTAYVWTKADLEEEDWSLHLLSEVRNSRRQALLYVAGGLMTLLLLTVAASVYRAAQLRSALALSNADRKRLTREIEERRNTEKKLESARSELAQKEQLAALGQLSASITHELGQPISAMRNYLVAEEIAANAEPNALWPQLSGLLDRMQRIVDQLRLFGRTSATGATAFPVQETVIAAAQLVQHTAREVGTRLTFDMPEEPVMVRGRPERFEQVIVNVLRNAIDATEGMDEGVVDLSMAERDDTVVVRIEDNGHGLGDLNIADLSKPFFSTKPSGKGMGLGLAISGQIINEMGGTLHAENKADRGAVFMITVPTQAASNG